MKRSTTGMLATSALLGVALLAPTPAVAVDGGEFSAEANGSQLFVDAVNFGALTAEPPVGSLAQIGVAPTQGQVDSTGLGDGVLSRAFGQNLDVSLLDQPLPVDQLSTAEQTAPEDNDEPTVSQLIPLDAASPLLTGSVLESTAWARTPEAVECPDVDQRSIISEGTSTTTDLGVLDIGEFSEDFGELVSVEDAGEGTLTSSSGTYVGSEGQVIAESSAQTATVNVADQLVVEVINPVLTATAPGTPGDASVEYSGEIRVNGERLAATEENRVQLDVLEPLLQPVDEMVLNEVFGPVDDVLSQITGPLAEALPLLDEETLTPELLTELIDNQDVDLDALLGVSPTAVVTAGALQSSTSQDGTSASGNVTAVTIEIHAVGTLLETGEVVGDPAPILTLDLMPMSASANAPTGGLDCGGVEDDGNPLGDVHKDVSAAKVRPGSTFDYAITVPNSDPSCTLTDVTVTDVVEGPGTIEDVTGDGDVQGNTVTWTIDELPPNESRTFIVTVQVDADATPGTAFDDRVTVTGDCDDESVEGGDTIDDLPVVTEDSLEGCDVSASNKSATHLEVAPGQTFSYLVHAYNAGDLDCGETLVIDTLPDDVTFVSCAPSCDADGQDVAFSLEQLAAGESVDLTITVTAPDEPTSDLVNVATIAPSDGSSTEVTTGIPDVTDRSVPAPPNPADFTGVGDDSGAGAGEQLPRTGGGAAVLALGALAAAGALRRRF